MPRLPPKMDIYTSTGDLVYSRDLTGVIKTSGTEWNLVHRAKLHSELTRIATSGEGLGSPAKLFLDCKLADLNVHEPSLKLATGEIFRGDLIIGADGIHSWTRSFVAPGHKPFPYGKGCFRWLGPYDELASDPETERYAGTGLLNEWAGSDRRVIYYPFCDHTMANYAGFVPAHEAGTTTHSWDNAASKEVLLKCFESFGPSVRSILSKASANKLKFWPLMDMHSLPTWTQGFVVLIGDAAHPFLPFMAQGGAMAIEDGASLGALLPLGTAKSDILNRLSLYEECRRGRVEHIQEFTRRNGRDPDGSRGPRPSCESFQAKRALTGQPLNQVRLAKEAMDFMAFCVQHDEWKHSSDVLRQSLATTDRV
ncbi:hypothetical protein CNMCM8927_008603 [Aspergillus lentulus]|uniref:FAD-binding domain-containing protein n=1 Tax=Aspergillus lentulus TaxID=293939 RepID=A0AAN5YMX0_ASPLE|nr:hypothetical protein CNMCM6069_007842 [Aspergillus lentulus]KAF4203556.1 hypothetical protein CNMCM8927_008603 [Aspergillus lentulus]